MEMEITVQPLVLSFAIICIATWAWKVLNWVWLRPKKLERCLRQQGLSGNSYRLLQGDLKEMSLMDREAMSRPMDFSNHILSRVVPYQQHCINKYGKSSFIWIGPTPRVSIMDPKLIKDVLCDHNVFIRPEVNPLARLLLNGLFFSEGEQWAKRRKIMNPAFNLEKLKHMLPAIQMSCDEMLTKWEMLVMENGTSELDVWPYIENMTGDVISRTTFGSNYEQGRRIFHLHTEQATLLRILLKSAYIPGWRFLPTKAKKRMKEIHKEVHSIMREIINKREKAAMTGEAKNDDLLGMLLESNQKEILEHGNKDMGMTLTEVMEDCKLFYFAGQETAANVLVWTMILLSKHPNWQARAREEILQVFGKNKPNFHELSRLKVVTMILCEVLRLYPPVELIRMTNKETKLGELSLPKGVQVSLPILLVHHDHDIWGDDAGQFKPERFSEGVSNAMKTQPAFLPFSFGPRVCVGQNMALIEIRVAVAMILQRFSFKLSPSYVHAPYRLLSLQPQHGAQIVLHKI